MMRRCIDSSSSVTNSGLLVELISLQAKTTCPFFVTQLNRTSSSSSISFGSQPRSFSSTSFPPSPLPSPSHSLSASSSRFASPETSSFLINQRQTFSSKKNPLPSPSTSTSTPTTTKSDLTDEELIKEAAKSLPWFGRVLVSLTTLFSTQPLLDIRSEKAYTAVEAAANSQALLDLCGFKRDFAAWFKLTILHLWIYFVRLRHAGEGSQDIQQTLLDKFWGQTERNLVDSGVRNRFLLPCPILLYSFLSL
jgi:hypothetical protein